jgi:outer membrane protein assembly factor BamE (lipoprotein component of BamABCDE complex)
MKRILIAVVAGLMLAGCASVTKTEGVKVDREKVLELKPGVTTRQAVLEAFGAPSEVINENNEERLSYVFKEKKTPSYLGGMVENEVISREKKTVLEVVLRNDVVYSYRYKSSEN